MNLINHSNLNKDNERILSLLEELNSTLDLYYERNIEKEVQAIEKWIKFKKKIDRYYSSIQIIVSLNKTVEI